ncbi:MAG TPA: restriction endonuclease subunit S [Gemmataceae bacterium]|nr:restriction endonuclease subunit S [Gemmataceae bacterium]
MLREQKQRIGTIDADNLPLLGVSNSEGLHCSGMPRISDMSRYLTVERNWFAYNPMRINVGSIGWAESANQTGVISPDHVVFSCTDRVEPTLVYLFLKHRRGLQAINAETAGSVRERLYFDSLARIKFPLPPVEEQRRLVERIDALAAKIEEAKQLRGAANHASDALMAAYTLEGCEELAKRHPVRRFAEFEPHVTSGPRNWGQRTVDSGDRFYRAQDVLPKGRLATSGKVFIESPDTRQGTGAKLKPGDLMIVITGATVGRVAVYPADSEPGYVSQHVAICRIDPAQLNPRFALQGLLSPYGQEQILGQRYGQGKPGLNLTNLRNLRLPVPPLPVQQRVVEDLGRLQERIHQLASQQAGSGEAVDAMLPAILDRAFRGEL